MKTKSNQKTCLLVTINVYFNVITSDHQQALYCMHAALDQSLIRSYGRGGSTRTLLYIQHNSVRITKSYLGLVRQRLSPSVKIYVMDGGKLSLKCKKRLEILNPIHLASTFFPLGRIKYSRYTFAKQES